MGENNSNNKGKKYTKTIYKDNKIEITVDEFQYVIRVDGGNYHLTTIEGVFKFLRERSIRLGLSKLEFREIGKVVESSNRSALEVVRTIAKGKS